MRYHSFFPGCQQHALRIYSLTSPFAVAKIHAVQAEYSPFETIHEDDDLINACRELDVAFVAYGPLGHGWLVEDFPYNSPEDFNDQDYRRESTLNLLPTAAMSLHWSQHTNKTSSAVPKFQGENFYANKKISEGFKELAKRKGCTVTQVALAWVAAQGMIAIPGTTKPTRLEENWASRDVELTQAELKEMRETINRLKPQGDRYDAKAAVNIGN